MLRNEKGFTLIEMIGVLLIMSIVFGIAITKHMNSSESAKLVAIKIIVSELTNLEKRAWLNQKMDGWSEDQIVFENLQDQLEDGLNINGGTLKGYELIRHPSNEKAPGYWELGGAI